MIERVEVLGRHHLTFHEVKWFHRKPKTGFKISQDPVSTVEVTCLDQFPGCEGGKKKSVGIVRYSFNHNYLTSNSWVKGYL